MLKKINTWEKEIKVKKCLDMLTEMIILKYVIKQFSIV